MKALMPFALLLASCGGNPPCAECPDIRGEYVMRLESVSALDSTCLRYASQGGTIDVVVQQDGSRIILQPFAWEGTLHENLALRFPTIDGETTDGVPTRERISGRVELDPAVSFTGKLFSEVPSESCGLVMPISWD